MVVLVGALGTAAVATEATMAANRLLGLSWCIWASSYADRYHEFEGSWNTNLWFWRRMAVARGCCSKN
jgi:hypothetical protein